MQDEAGEGYFPVLPGRALKLEALVRRACRRLPDPLVAAIYSQGLTRINWYTRTRIKFNKTWTEVSQGGRNILFPKPLPRIKYQHISSGYVRHLHNKYTLPGFVEIREGDTVIDCGAFVGGFSIAAAERGARVIAVEPEERNAYCCRENLKMFEDAEVLEKGLFNEDGEVLLNISPEAVEHSILKPDNGVISETNVIAVSRIDTLVRELGLMEVNFLKVEAEGVEPEIIYGLGDVQPQKIAVDISPERDGASPLDEISDRLKALGYEVRVRYAVLFARR